MNVCSFIFTEKRRIAQISNVHLFSRQLSSGQSFADLLLVADSVPVFHTSPEGLSPPSGSQGGRARRSHPDPLNSNGKFPPVQQKVGKDAVNI